MLLNVSLEIEDMFWRCTPSAGDLSRNFKSGRGWNTEIREMQHFITVPVFSVPRIIIFRMGAWLKLEGCQAYMLEKFV